MANVILIGGLPGSGKSTLSEALASKLKMPLFSKDRLEASIVQNGLAQPNALNDVGYTLLKNLVDEHEKLNQSVIIDFIANKTRVAKLWPSLLSTNLIVIECICSDRLTHKNRIESRTRGIDGWYELSWEDVEKASREYKPLVADRLIVDSMDTTEVNLKLATEYIRSGVG